MSEETWFWGNETWQHSTNYSTNEKLCLNYAVLLQISTDKNNSFSTTIPSKTIPIINKPMSANFEEALPVCISKL